MNLKSNKIFLAGLALFASMTAAHAQEVISVKGTTDGVSFAVLSPNPITTSGFPAFSFGDLISVTVPTGDACTVGECQGAIAAPGGQIRLTTNPQGTGGQTNAQATFTFGFPQFIHAGYYTTAGGGGFEAGTMIVSGIDATAGSPQSTAIGTQFSTQLEATVTNIDGSYASGITVTFTAPGSGPSATFVGGGNTTTAVTDANGRARVTVTANGTAGAYQIIASATVGGHAVQFPFVMSNVNTTANSGSCTVSDASDDLGAGSLRSLIASCGKGATITFGAAGTLSYDLQYVDIPLIQDVTIDGSPFGPTGLIIEPNSTRLFFITGGTITIKNLGILHGGVAGGAGGYGVPGSFGGGGGAAGMGGAIFQNGGALVLNNVTFEFNTASGGAGGGTDAAFDGSGGGGGFSGPGGSGFSTPPGNGGGGGDFGTSGGAGVNITGGSGANGSGGGGGGELGGGGGFGGGGGGALNTAGAGGFGGGGGGGLSSTAGTFGGAGNSSGTAGGGAGLGGAIFVNSGALMMVGGLFVSNNAQAGAGGTGGMFPGGSGQGKGGALFINSLNGATAVYSTGSMPSIHNNSADTAGAGTTCPSVLGTGALDTNDICGILSVAPATHFTVTATTPTTAGTPSSVMVTALDFNNATVTGYTGTVQFTSSDTGSPTLPANYTFTALDAGVHTFTNGVTFHTAGTQTITATDTGTSATGTSNNVTVTPGPVHAITVAIPASQVPGIAFNNGTITLKDAFNNTIATTTDTFQFSSTDAAASLPSTGTLSSLTFTATFNTKGTQTITVTDTSVSVSGTSNNVTVTAAPPTMTAAFSPTSVASGNTSNLTITVNNPNSIALTHVAFSNTLPSGLTLITQSSGTCGISGAGAPAAGTAISMPRPAHSPAARTRWRRTPPVMSCFRSGPARGVSSRTLRVQLLPIRTRSRGPRPART